MFQEKTIQTLEFPTILEMISEFALSSTAKEKIIRTVPVSDFDTVNRLLDLTDEAYIVTTKYLLKPLSVFDNISVALEKARIGTVLNMSDLLKIARIIKCARIAKKSILDTGTDIVYLKEIVLNVHCPEHLEKDITDAILGENEMSDRASPALRDIRKKLQNANGRLKEKLYSYTKSNRHSKYLQDNLVTLRNGRYVLPVKAEYRSEIPGLVHDQSASGATVFLEPLEIVEMNNARKTLESEELREIERILAEFSGLVQQNHPYIVHCQDCITELDIIFAKSSYSAAIEGIKPRLNQNGQLYLKRSRHPLIDKKQVIPVTISIGKDYKILIISGPNTGGKTVCLKTAGLFCLMSYAGIKIPCEEGSEVAMFEDIFCDIGDEQSIQQSLSTFSSHISNIVHITDRLTPNCLVLLDEIGAGTDPAEGASLAIGILKYLELMRSVAIITTHYSDLKEYAFLSPQIENACMVFDEATLRPSYKMIIGIPGTSNALYIAKNLGINDYILSRAYDNMKDEKVQFENVLKGAEEIKTRALAEYEQLHESKLALEAEKGRLEQERHKLEEKIEKLNFNMRIELKKHLSKALEKANEMIEQIQENIHAADAAALLQAKKNRSHLEDMFYNTDTEDTELHYKALDISRLFLGQKVYVGSLKSVGELKALPNKKEEVIVKIGAMTLNINVNDLKEPILAEKTKPKKRPPVPERQRPAAPETVTKEMKVLGMTVAEAVEIIEPMLFALSMEEGGQILKIVHGKGSGALGRGIQQFLKSSHFVRTYRYGKYGEGESGVTFVEIKTKNT